MQHLRFNNNFIKKMLNKNKRGLIVGHFNLKLIKYRQIAGVNQFLEVLLTNDFINNPSHANKSKVYNSH